MSSPGTTSYRLSIVTIGLSLTVFAVLRMFQTDERNWSIANGGNKVHRPPKDQKPGCRYYYITKANN